MQLNKLELIKGNLGKNAQPIIDKTIPNIPAVYLIFNRSLELIYIGQTKYLRQRLVSHISPNNHSRLENGGYYGQGINNCSSIIPCAEIGYFSYVQVDDERERKLKESMLIMTLNPKYQSR